MKAITLWQPWASLLVHGLKQIETRSWGTPCRGLLLIHAAKVWNPHLDVICRSEPFRSALESVGVAFPDPSGRKPDRRFRNPPKPNGLPFGAIVGRVEVLDCVRVEPFRKSYERPETPMFVVPPYPRDYEFSFGDFTPGQFAWFCVNATALETPIVCAGRQGLFDVDESVLSEVAISRMAG